MLRSLVEWLIRKQRGHNLDGPPPGRTYDYATGVYTYRVQVAEPYKQIVEEGWVGIIRLIPDGEAWTIQITELGEMAVTNGQDDQ
jgi:hypothetical protein